MQPQMQPPQQRGGIDQRGDVRLALAHQALVEDAQRRTHIALIEKEQCFVPPQVDGEVGAASPDAALARQPGRAVGAAPAHVQGVRHSVNGAGLVGHTAQGLAPHGFGRHRVGGLGQTKCVHRQHVAVARLIDMPMPQRSRDAIAQLVRAAPLQVTEMRHAQRQRVFRVALRNLAVQAQRTLHVLVQPGVRCREVGTLALAGPGDMSAGAPQGVGQHR